MGYTHYWDIKSELTEEKWDEFKSRCKEISLAAQSADIPLSYEYDMPDANPVFSSFCVRFNGIGDEGHESFYIARAPVSYNFSFCKTARKPYDAVVVACLMEASRIFGEAFTWSSDGDGEPGQKDAAEALLKTINQPPKEPA